MREEDASIQEQIDMLEAQEEALKKRIAELKARLPRPATQNASDEQNQQPWIRRN